MSGGCFQQTNRKTAVLASLNEFINNIPTCLLFPSTVFKQFLYLVIFVPFQVIPQKKKAIVSINVPYQFLLQKLKLK